jgi:DNA polymerase I-like protein with 3'-5' exonuclease and polymerase domains
MSQLEMRMAAYASGDRAMIAACESSDLHAANAQLIFEGKFLAERYLELKAAAKAAEDAGTEFAHAAEFGALESMRTMAKSSGFAVGYGAAADTVYTRLIASGAKGVTLRGVEAVLQKLRRAFQHYYAWSARNLEECRRTGYVYSPVLKRRRWLGKDPGEPEVLNSPIQSGAADLMNSRLPEIAAQLPKDEALVAQVHDAAYFEIRCDRASTVSQLCTDVMTAPFKIDSSGETLWPSFPIDKKVADRWS